MLLLLFIGIEPYVVLSGSMEPRLETGSLCFINKKDKFESLKKNDIIAFKMKDGSLVTHRVVEIDNNGIVTKGDANESNDLALVNKNNYVGKTIFSIPKIGYVVKSFQSPNGKIISFAFVILLFVIAFLFGEDEKNKEKKKEKNEELEDELNKEL